MYGYEAPPGMRQEQVLLAEQGVQVTTARFVVRQQTYPMGAITSVAPFAVPASRGGYIFLAVIGGAVALIMLLAALAGGAGFLVGVAFGGVLATIGVIGAVSAKANYGVRITTSGMNVQALWSRDQMFVGRVVAAINQALASR